MCEVNLDEDLQDVFNVTIEWSRNESPMFFNDSDYAINLVSFKSHSYISTLHIRELKHSDNEAIYFCNVTVELSVYSEFIFERRREKQIILSVQG